MPWTSAALSLMLLVKEAGTQTWLQRQRPCISCGNRGSWQLGPLSKTSEEKVLGVVFYLVLYFNVFLQCCVFSLCACQTKSLSLSLESEGTLARVHSRTAACR